MQHKCYNNTIVGQENNYQTFQGQELEEELGKNTLAYQWRDYDPAIARFNKIDRFAEKYVSHSPYSFTKNNPIRYREMKGDSIWFTMSTTESGQTHWKMHFRGKVLNASDKDIDMKKYVNSLTSKLAKAFTKSNKNFKFSTDIKIESVESASEVNSSDHLQVIVDDVTYDDSLTWNTNGVARMNGKISYVEAGGLFSSPNIDEMSTIGVHEFGHNFGLKHNWEDELSDSNSNTNYMSYGANRSGVLSQMQLNSVIGSANAGELNQGTPTQRATRSTSHWIYHNATNSQPYDFNVKKGDIIPTIIRDK